MKKDKGGLIDCYDCKNGTKYDPDKCISGICIRCGREFKKEIRRVPYGFYYKPDRVPARDQDIRRPGKDGGL